MNNINLSCEHVCKDYSGKRVLNDISLTIEPGCIYGLIGRNMLALGYEQEAMDAFSRYLWAVKRAGGEAEFDQELDTLEEFELERPQMRARYDAQLGIASRRLAAGDFVAAERALRRAKPARDVDDRYDSLHALVLQARGDAPGAMAAALRACRQNPMSARARCTLAGAYCLARKRAKAASALLAAALRCESEQDAQLFCYSAVSLGFPELSLCVLRASLRRSPDRLPAAYNASVTMLKLGRLEDAEPFIHHCRDLDPLDVPSRCMWRTLEQWRDLSLDAKQVELAARALPFYPLLSPAQSNDCLSQLAQALGEGIETFCERLQQDETLYATLLYELGNPEHQLSRLIPAIASGLPADFAQRMLREVLVQQTPDDSVKRQAAAALMSLGAKPPFVVWHSGRIAEIDPSVQNHRDASMSRVMLVRRMADIQRGTGDTRLMTHALLLLNRMGARHRGGVVRDTNGVFRAALEQHYLMTFGLPDNQRLHRLLKYTADERRRVRAAFHAFCMLVPLPRRKPRK